MNNTIYYDFAFSDDERRRRLYDGQLFVFSPRKSIMDFVNFARSIIQDAFGDLDPRTAQDGMEVERYADLLGKLKPTFIHHRGKQASFASNPAGFRLRVGADLFRRPQNA